ncbi:MAG: two-component sensor histidine kinase, partial [Caldilineaceae bacterium]|nr:two-component sensor histidine kinase [Caldilineaceae bacterium]
FWRGDRARSHRDGVGGGLGLAIVRQLVEAHGGQIAVESVVGEGTRFVVELGRA